MSNLAFQLLAAANYIDALGGVSQSYRQALAAHEAAKPAPNAWRCAKCQHLYEEKVTLCDCMPEKQEWLPAFVSDAAPAHGIKEQA